MVKRLENGKTAKDYGFFGMGVRMHYLIKIVKHLPQGKAARPC
jgi:hypothetical protein